MRERERETTEHSPTRAQPGSQEAPPPAGGEVGISKSKCKAKLVAVVGAQDIVAVEDGGLFVCLLTLESGNED